MFGFGGFEGGFDGCDLGLGGGEITMAGCFCFLCRSDCLGRSVSSSLCLACLTLDFVP